MPVIREIGPYQEEPTVKEIGPYKAAQSIREIGPYKAAQSIREIGPYKAAQSIREIGPYKAAQSIREIGPYKAAQSIREIGPYDDAKAIREIGPLRPEKKPRPAPSFMELQQGFGVLPAIGLKAVQGAATAIDKVFGDTEAEKEQQRRDTSGAMIEESTPANIALGLAGAKGLSMLTKTPFAPVREAVEAVTQIPMPWKWKKQQNISMNNVSQAIATSDIIDPKIESLTKEATRYGNKLDFIEKYYTETSYDFKPGVTRIATTGETGLYHGAGITNLKSILSDGKIRTNISDLDNVGENAISVSGNRSVAGSYGVIFELDDTLPKRVAPYEAIKGDVFDGFEYRLDNDVPLSSVKNVTIPLNRSEGIKTKIMWDYRNKPEYISASDLAEIFRSKGIKVFYDDGSTFSKKNLGSIWDKAHGIEQTSTVGKTDWMTNIVTGQDKTLREFESGVNGAIPKEAVTRATQKDLASKIVENEQSLAQLLAKKPADGFSAVDQVALADIGDKTLKDIADHAIAEGWDSTMFREAQDRIFGQVAIARTEAGRALEANKYKLASRRLQSAFGKLNRGLNEREQNEFLDLIKMGALDDPRAVKRFAARLGDPKKMDYVWEYWYNSILSGIPTHMVNTLSNTMWQAWQVPHGALTAGIDKAMSVFRGGKREYLLKEVIPSWAGVKTGFTKGRKGAWEMVRTGKTTEWESKIDADIGGAIISAFERSPNKILKKAAPYVTWPSRFLGASDVWFKSIAFDSKLAALARAKGITPDKASKEMIDQASDYARYVTFTDEPGKIASFLVGMRDNPEHPLAGGLMRLIMPFVSTPGNLLKRGLEMTPGIGLLAKGRQPIQEVAAKQIEGAVIAAALFAKIDKGEITGPAPINKAEREIFYANGKLPWAVKVGDKWMQYRRIEPFNMPVAMAAVAYEQIKNAKSEEEASKVAWNVVNGIKEHVIDSSYLQGVQNLLSPQGKLEGAAQRTLASFVPMSSFNRSINRAIESGVEGAARLRDTKSLAGAFSQVIPGGYSWTEPKLDVLGQPQQIQGGPARQFFPYKYGEEGGTPITQELDRLGVYPGHAEQSITIGGVKKKLDNGVYRDYQERLGQRIEERINRVMSMPGYATAPDERKAKMIKRAIQSARDIELKKLKREYKYRKNMMELED